MAESWHTLGGRLRWAFERQPRQGRQRGLRLFQRRMERHGPDIPGTSLSAIQGYLKDDDPTEPSPRFLALAARLLSVRPTWLTWGAGAPTEEGEAERREAPETELFRISDMVYEAMGVPTQLPAGTRTLQDPEGTKEEADRFGGSAAWAPLVRQTALRLYQYRPAWDLLEGGDGGGFDYDDPEAADSRFWEAVADTAQGIAMPLRALGIRGDRLSLEDVADYVSALALLMQRAIYRY